MKKNDKSNNVPISENEIKKKLYGKSEKRPDKKNLNKESITEKQIMKKLYPDNEKAVSSKQTKAHKNDFLKNSTKIQPGIQEEIRQLKVAVANLEERLKTALEQKERLKVKLVQKRKLINIRERMADLMLNRMPEKFIILLIVFFIFCNSYDT